MKVSLNTVKQFTPVDISVDDLVSTINQQLGGVEEVTSLGGRYDGAVIAKIVSCHKHENADKLNVCMIDDGSGELTQVVCGAPNAREGIFVVWLKPGSTVPSTSSDDEPFVLGARELRGVMSNGMLASPKELGIGDGHEGILEISEQDLREGRQLAAGASFADMFDLNDTIIDIENKMFTHRPDLFGQLGVAREIAGIQHNKFASPDWYIPNEDAPEMPSDALELTVFNDVNEKVPRFLSMAVKDVAVKPSPLWLQCALVALGGKPINNIVDATNYVMLLTAQPTHAYDYDKLRGHRLGARMAHDKEIVKLLNGKTYELTGDDIVIADGEGAVGLAGIMGGSDSEVSDDTRHIVLEVANFDMYTVRKSSMRHGVFTDALTRFNKGQSPQQNAVVLNYLVSMIERLSGGKIASGVYDTQHTIADTSSMHATKTMNVEPRFINERLGLQLTADESASFLVNVEFNVAAGDGALVISTPFWRTDIELPEDIVEEVGRLYGFDRLPRVLPERTTKAAPKNLRRERKQSVRDSLRRAGANEVLTYSFVHEKTLRNSEYGTDDAYALSNALSPDLQYYRQQVLPSLLDKVHPNIKSGYNEFVLFEVGKGHDKSLEPDEDGLPREKEYVSMVYAAKQTQDGAAFYKVRRLLDQLAIDMGMQFSYARIDDAGSIRLFDPARSATIRDAATGTVIGTIGEVTTNVAKKFKLPQHFAAATLDFDALYESAARAQGVYRPLSRYPSISQDVSLKVAGSMEYSGLAATANAVLAELDDSLLASLRAISIYQPEDRSDKTVTFRLHVTSYDRTLTDDAVKKIIDTISQRAADDFNATVV
jgi:phenylalanyl-tRNA synthetase beta chain